MVVVLLVLLALQVDAQFTVDDDGVCQPFKWGDMVDLIRAELKDVKTVIQQQGNGVSMSSPAEEMTNFRQEVVREMKTVIQQQMGSSMTSLHEDVRQIRQDFQELKTTCASTQQQQQPTAVDESGSLCK